MHILNINCLEYKNIEKDCMKKILFIHTNYREKGGEDIAFENEIGEGYVTEKILHPMSVNSIPIYWGSDLVNQDFNSESFINARNYENDEELIDGILDLENNKELYMEKLAKPWFKDNKFPEYALPQNVLKFINEVLNS